MKPGYVQLPNGDLWRGADLDAAPRPDTVDATPEPKTSDDYIADMMTSQRGEMLSCTHCGAQYSRKQLNELREHFETLHMSALKPVTDEQALAAVALTSGVIKA